MNEKDKKLSQFLLALIKGSSNIILLSFYLGDKMSSNILGVYKHDENNIFGLGKNTYPADKVTSHKWEVAVERSRERKEVSQKMEKMVPGKYGAITIKKASK